MIAEREAHLNAGSYERSESRDGYANGFKPRSLQTRVGRLSLHIPQVRVNSTLNALIAVQEVSEL